jgi:hypothetical protein
MLEEDVLPEVEGCTSVVVLPDTGAVVTGAEGTGAAIRVSVVAGFTVVGVPDGEALTVG